MPKFSDINPVSEIFPRGIPVSRSPDLERILALPRRKPLDLEGLESKAMISLIMDKYAKDNVGCKCKTIDNQIALGNRTCIKQPLPLQAWSLYEIGIVKGLVGALPVGSGKTYLSVMSALALDEDLSLLLVPSNLLEQLIVDYQLIDQHFDVPGIIVTMAGNREWRRLVKGKPILHVLPYSLLQGKKNSDWVERLAPKAIIADEVDGLADLGSSRTKRIIRYFSGNDRMTDSQRAERSRTKFCCWTGTLTDKSITEYCVDPNTKILTTDLKWVKASEIRANDKIIGFDEHLPNTKMRTSTVEEIKTLNQPRVKLITNKGTLICSVNHKWILKGRPRTYHNKKYTQLGFGGYNEKGNHRSKQSEWIDAKDIKPGDLLGYYIDPWEEINTRDAGYLAGLYDGEGWVSHTNVFLAQNSGLVFDKAKTLLDHLGFEYTIMPQSGGSGKCNRLTLIGEKSGLQFLGSIRPERLLAKASLIWENRAQVTKKARVLKVEYLDHGPVIAIQTSTKTFIAEGFLSHNCHLSAFALKEKSPLPLDQETALEWSRALDAVPNPSPPGALQLLCNPGESPRQAFGRRVRETMGFIVTGTSEVRKPNSIELVKHRIIERQAPPLPDIVQEAMDKVRDFKRPDTLAGNKYDEELVEAMEQARIAQQVATGMFYRWIYPRREPDELIDKWMEARKAWNKEKRYKLFEGLEYLDSESLLEDAAMRAWGDAPPGVNKYNEPLPDWKAVSWPAWRDIQNLVQPKTKAVRLHPFLVEDAVDWANTNKGIVWYSMIEFGQWMKELSGLPMHDGGKDADRRLRMETGERSILASLKSNYRGRNGLQYIFHKQLITQVFASSKIGEQLLGRVERQGQKNDVLTEIYLHVPEVEKSFRQALMRAKYNEETMSQKQKIIRGWFEE